jgi:hypothetical protein
LDGFLDSSAPAIPGREAPTINVAARPSDNPFFICNFTPIPPKQIFPQTKYSRKYWKNLY